MPVGAVGAAAGQLRAGLRANAYPFSWMGKAAGLEAEPPSDDAELLLRTLAATISPQEETGLAPEDEASILALEHGDWAGSDRAISWRTGHEWRPERTCRSRRAMPGDPITGERRRRQRGR